ncbi:3-carboxy-cis,cis-muconate cycloisomerase [Faunimonas pinastri]|uniref:3-carboxy-cis,cis-muconate cycloisomerase n=1 Tax=Faunimonas pinastri TaxID=1855383 RepID=A0A1H9K7H2_9HYPH|nr:adenylosuccinate lyase family protein [Faunimonas pinastri]SEQ95022.1 3-carboxy-cis,cis-muconate cycloisomerase [Faunimonas pinastri]
MTFSALDSELLGPLFATDAMRDVFSDRARLAGMLRMECALAKAAARFDLAPPELAPAIEAIGPDQLDLQQLGRDTAVSGVPVIPFVKAVQKLLPKDLESAFHKGATTQDVADTALVLQVRAALDLIAGDLDAVMRDLASLAQRHRGTPCVGRTYGQHAAPITFGFKVAVWLSGVAETAEKLPDLRRRVLVASLGGPVGTLTTFRKKGPAVAEAFAGELGLGTATLSWHTGRGRIAGLGAWLAELIGALAKIATDVASLASTEVGEASEPHIPGRGGSSAMPHKRNPVSATIILAAHAAARGHLTTLFDAMAAAHERPPGLWHAEWHALPQLFGLLSGALREARSLAGGLVVDADRMQRNLEATKGLLFADAVAGRLAPKLGRGKAHEVVEEAATRVRDGDVTLQQALERNETLRSEAADFDLAGAFDLQPAIDAASVWVDRALAEADRVRALLPPNQSTGN